MTSFQLAQGGDVNLDTIGLCLLSLDGGGVRGLSSLYVLKALMDKLNKARLSENKPEVKPCELFDLIGGTSTGGIIAIMLGRLEMSVDTCIEAYCSMMGTVFGQKQHSLPINFTGQIQSRFDSSKLKAAIEEVIIKAGWNPSDLFNDGVDRGCKVFVCAATRELYGITTLRSYSLNDEINVPATICEAALATSAATSFFEPVSIGVRSFVDGALGANNPVDQVEREATNFYCNNTGDLKAQVKCFVSIGTGNPGKKALEDNALKFHTRSLRHIATETEETAEKFIARWRGHYDQKRYFRFNVEHGLQDVGLAEYAQRARIETATFSYIASQVQKFRMRDCVENLQKKQSMSPVALGAILREHDTNCVKFLKSLSTLQYEDHKLRNPMRAPGTCEWFLNHEHFLGWRDKKSGLLWVSADPGTGKSVLARCLIDEILPSTDTRITTYFFFKDDFEDQKSVHIALRCVLRQIYRQCPDLVSDRTLKRYEEEGEAALTSLHFLWGLLLDTARRYKSGEIVCILDALDECEQSGQEVLMTAFEDAYKTSRTWPNIKFLITSRPYTQIQRGFQLLKNEDNTIHLCGETEAEVEKLSREIDIVIGLRVNKLAKQLQLQPDEEIILHDELTAVRNRTYLWVYLVVDFIRKECLCRTKDKLRAAIHKLPVSVHDAYEKILSRSPNVEEAKKLLHLVVAAQEPLSIQAMATAMALEKHHKYRRELDIEPDSRLRDWIRTICGLFVIVVDSKVYLLHQTARNFLLRPSSVPASSCSGWQHSLWLPKSNGIMADICMQYLLLSGLDSPDPFFNYSAAWWVEHYHQSDSSQGNERSSSMLRLCRVWHTWSRAHPDLVRNSGLNPLVVASILGLNPAVQQFLEEGFSIRPRHLEQSALHRAVEFGRYSTVELLLEKDTRSKNFFMQSIVELNITQTPLEVAVWNGHASIVQLLLQKGSKIKPSTEKARRLLKVAAANGHVAVVQLLLENGAKIDEKHGSHLDAALRSAVEHGQIDVVRFLLSKGANIKARDEYRLMALNRAVALGQIDIVKLLLENGAKIDEEIGSPPEAMLLSAMRSGQTDIVRFLLNKGANIHARDENGYTVLHFVARYGAPIYVVRASHLSLEDDSADILELLLEKGANVEAKTDIIQMTPLAYAVSSEVHRNGVAVKALLDNGADIEAKGSRGQTPLCYAASTLWSNKDTIKLLLSRGAVFEPAGSLTETLPLVAASRYGHEANVTELLFNGARVNVQDSAGRTPFLEACKRGNRAIVKMLHAYGAKINVDEILESMRYFSRTRVDAAVELIQELLDEAS